MMITIKCPSCGTEGSQSLLEPNYQGPYRCWKCRSIFVLEVKNNILKSIKAISNKEFEKWQKQQKIEKWRLDSKQEKD